MLSMDESPSVIGGKNDKRVKLVVEQDMNQGDEEEDHSEGVLKSMHMTGDKSERK